MIAGDRLMICLKLFIEFKLNQANVLFSYVEGFYGRVGFILENYFQGNVQRQSC